MNSKNEDATEDTIQFKKDKLMCHVPFIKKMIEKFKGTEFEGKWQTMLTCIVSNHKR